jgi:hypothetical protein
LQAREREVPHPDRIALAEQPFLRTANSPGAASDETRSPSAILVRIKLL